MTEGMDTIEWNLLRNIVDKTKIDQEEEEEEEVDVSVKTGRIIYF